ncbi:hypothetical protein AAFF_G00373740 [Aldrovandia affinis]|uniref:Uncharacterized protein n=1 Tax=Aldrovandia affinis TaxID=143900 RepID=A0AAD7R4U4_9TELE|nr:hypothetical protein AAFF_G00373740 [Aldrovandia affinis]
MTLPPAWIPISPAGVIFSRGVGKIAAAHRFRSALTSAGLSPQHIPPPPFGVRPLLPLARMRERVSHLWNAGTPRPLIRRRRGLREVNGRTALFSPCARRSGTRFAIRQRVKKQVNQERVQ